VLLVPPLLELSPGPYEANTGAAGVAATAVAPPPAVIIPTAITAESKAFFAVFTIRFLVF
jgi:hypothetical protein